MERSGLSFLYLGMRKITLSFINLNFILSKRMIRQWFGDKGIIIVPDEVQIAVYSIIIAFYCFQLSKFLLLLEKLSEKKTWYLWLKIKKIGSLTNSIALLLKYLKWITLAFVARRCCPWFPETSSTVTWNLPLIKLWIGRTNKIKIRAMVF